MKDANRFTVQTTNLTAFEQASQQFIDHLAAHFRGEKRATVLGYLVGEIEANIKEHSKAKTAVLVLVAPANQFSLEDDGIGIGNSFRAVNTGLVCHLISGLRCHFFTGQSVPEIGWASPRSCCNFIATRGTAADSG